ncbi:MAG TPA: SRPBCC domain-containing protein [Amycolatopsis sp.]|nr:SRPBCC domain-containing protein [Amycolatopsis sp.]
MSDEVKLEVTVAAPAEDVRKALRDKEKIRHWFGWDYEGLDQEIDMVFFSEVTEKGHTLSLHGGDLFELEPDGDGTRITLTRAPRGTSPEWDAYYDDITEGWITFLQQLKFALERHPGEPRRTVFHAGAGPAPDFGVSGETWFKSENQLGVVVPEWGDGLLIVGYNAAKDQSMAVLTTYGLDDDAFRVLHERWNTATPAQ